MQKKATLISEAEAAVEFEVLDADGTSVFKGTSKPLGFDTESGDTVHELDFTALDKEGTYTIKAASGETSRISACSFLRSEKVSGRFAGSRRRAAG